MRINKLIMDLHGNKKTTIMEAYGGLKEMHGDIKVAQQQYGTKGAAKINIEARPWLDPISTFH